MPRLLTRDDLSQVRATPSGVVRGPRPGTGAAIAGLGRDLQQGVEIDRSLERQKQDEDDALDLTKARAALQVSLMQERQKYDYQKDQDYSTWRSRFDDAAPVIHENVGDLIRNPRLREKFMADTRPEIVRYGIDIDQDARKVDVTRKIQDSDNALDAAIQAATAPDASPETQKKIIDDAASSVDGLVKYGIYTPEAGAARRVKFLRDYATGRAMTDVASNPAQAAVWLRGGGAQSGDLIRDKEGFKPVPYNDGGVLRIGYGSDTVTTADGKVVKVVPGMRVTREDAERDLKRRMGDYENDIVKKIGTDAWSKWSPGAQEVLRSLAHNYGTVPDSVIAAAKTGDPSILAQAIRARAGDKGNGIPGYNAKRRFDEAAIVEGGPFGKGKPVYYDFLTSEAKLKLLAGAETDMAQLDQQEAQAQRQAEADLRAQQGERKGQLDLGIEQGQVSREAIINDPLIDEGDKAILIRRWEEKEKDNLSAAAVWQAIANGEPLPENSGKGLDTLFKQVGGAPALVKGDPKAVATLDTFWRKAQAMPPSAKSALQGMVTSGDKETAINGLAILDQLQRQNGGAFDRSFDESTAKALTYYQNKIGFKSAEAIFQDLQKMRDPAVIKARVPMVEEGRKKAQKDYTAEDIAGKFGGLISTPGLSQGMPGEVQDSAMLEADFHDTFAEAYADDPENAEANALQMLNRKWGVSPVNNGNVMRYPPERYYPKLDGEWMQKDLEADLKKLGYTIAGGPVAPGIKAPDRVRNYVIQPIPLTESDIAAGRSPHYAVNVFDPNTGKWDAVLDKDGAPMAYQWDPEPHLKARQSSILDAGNEAERQRKAGVRKLNEAMRPLPIEGLDQ